MRVLFGLSLLLASLAYGAESVKIVGSGTVATAITPAVEAFKKVSDFPIDLQPRPSIAGIFNVAVGKADVGLTITSVTDAQRQLYPQIDFQSTAVGRGEVYLMVSPDVWDAGIRALSREQVRKIVEKEVTNWKDFGGEDFPITFFPRVQGH